MVAAVVVVVVALFEQPWARPRLDGCVGCGGDGGDDRLRVFPGAASGSATPDTIPLAVSLLGSDCGGAGDGGIGIGSIDIGIGIGGADPVRVRFEVRAISRSGGVDGADTVADNGGCENDGGSGGSGGDGILRFRHCVAGCDTMDLPVLGVGGRRS